MPSGSVMVSAGSGGVRVHVRGRLDQPAAHRLAAVLQDTAPGEHARVDLSRAGTLPVAVLRALADAHRRLGPGALVVENPSAAATTALRTSGLHAVLRVDVVERAPRRPAPVVLPEALEA